MRAVLDACVLYPTVLREILLGVAARGLYEPVFSERILREWVLATAKLGPVAQAQAEVEAGAASRAFPRALVTAEAGLQARLHLPDPDDVHVLATAVAAHADAIVTFNAQDFPRPVLADHGLDRRDPDGFLWELWSHRPAPVAEVVQAVHATAERLSGETIPLRKLLKKAQLWRLGKALDG